MGQKEYYRAAFLTGDREIVLGSLQIPDLGTKDVLIRIHRANLCPTDLKKYYHLDEKSLRAIKDQGGVILGHEASGIVEKVGADVTDIKPGMRVAIDPMLPCGTCDYCKEGDYPLCENLKGVGVSAGSVQDSIDLLNHGIGGTFADFVKVPDVNVYPLPSGLSLEAGAMMEPLADVLHSLEVGAPQRDETVVVFGLGAMGLMHVKVMNYWGIKRIIGVDPLAQRRMKAEEFGAMMTIDPKVDDPIETLKKFTGGLGPELLFICAGGVAQKVCAQQAFQAVRKKGRIMLYASAIKPADISIDINHIHYGMITLTGTVGFYRQHAVKALELLQNGALDIDKIRTPSFPLEKLKEAFELTDHSEVIKVGVDIYDG